MTFRSIEGLSIAIGSLCLLGGTAQAQFQDNQSDIPQGGPGNNSRSENVDFGDVDLDGDWDAVFADGGDAGNDRNRIWINQGGDQNGTTGIFLDATAARFPTGTDQSRDIEFADIDNDTDLDLYISNTSAITNQSNRWWINDGFDQSGSVGFYTDDTLDRWVGLGGPDSSVPSSAVLGSGGFIDWSCDCDFGDLDNDGDLDLFHSTYGGSFAGSVPSRIFLNDGDGFFEEFNPDSVNLTGTTISNGDGAIWAEGNQQQNTTNNTGASADIATNGLDVDLGDIDGDFDLDVLHGARDQLPRIYANRLEGSSLAPANGGELLFRDVTNMTLGNSHGTTGNYEQEFGDLDGDGDLDIYGMNWQGLFTDAMFRNNGSGIYTGPTNAPGSGSDDNEADFLDYNNDGNLDVYVANFSGQDRLYRGNGTNMTLQNVTGAQLPSLGFTGLDADACDVDGDGDYDIFVGNDFGARNYYLKNLNNTPDTHAPYLPNVEQAPDRSASATPTVVRAQVYDNAPYYITWYNNTWVSVTVNGGSATTYPAMSSAGQIFRAEIPGTLVGNICYTFFSEDEYGNQGQSAEKCYTATGGGGCNITNFCSSDNNSTGFPAIISTNGDCVVANDNLQLTAGPVPDQFGIFFYSLTQNNGGAGAPFGNGTLCLGGGGAELCRLDIELASGNVLTHNLDMGNPPTATCEITSGSTWHFQAWFRDPAGGGSFFDLSDATTVVFQ